MFNGGFQSFASLSIPKPHSATKVLYFPGNSIGELIKIIKYKFNVKQTQD